MNSQSKKNILITGGSGFLGINLIRRLLQVDEFTITNLDIIDFDYDEVNDINSITGDIRNCDDVKKAIQGIDIVIHSAAALPLYSDSDIYTTHVDGTRILLEQAYQQKVERFIHISSTAVYGVPDNSPITEEEPLDGVGAYGESKVQAESLCNKFRNLGMCMSIIRPKSFVGPERLGVFAILYDWAYSGKNFPILGRGNNLYQYLDVEDLCDAIYLAMIVDKNIANNTFNVGAKSFGTLKDDFQAVLDHADNGKRVICLPLKPAIWALRLLEFFNLSPLYKWVYETVSKDSYVCTAKAEELLGFNPRYSNSQALIRNYDWYINNLNKFEKQFGVSHRKPWKQGMLELAKLFF